MHLKKWILIEDYIKYVYVRWDDESWSNKKWKPRKHKKKVLQISKNLPWGRLENQSTKLTLKKKNAEDCIRNYWIFTKLKSRREREKKNLFCIFENVTSRIQWFVFCNLYIFLLIQNRLHRICSWKYFCY